MTPEEKAKELRDKYIFTSLDSNDDYETLKLKILIHAKRCAIMTVDEILNEYPNQCPKDSHEMERHLYWQEVKNELQKL